MAPTKKSDATVKRTRLGDKHEALATYKARTDATSDAARSKQLEARQAKGLRTARQNLEQLVDPDSFIESGQFTVAAQRSRKPLDELIAKTSNDGLVTGLATINSDAFSKPYTQVAVAINDYSVLAATQGYFHHKKLDRIIGVAKKNQLPMVMYTEGGGGRPGDTDVQVNVTGLDVTTFSAWASLKTLKIAVNRGYCFAGNAVLFGCADLRIATRDSCIGMAGPAMIEGGGMGSFTPQQIGPAETQHSLGAIDFLVDDEPQATQLARNLLGYIQGETQQWTAHDQALLWDCLPDDRRYSYDIRKLIQTLVDQDSFVEYQSGCGRALCVGFVRVAGRPLAIIANDTRVMGGALDRDASDKASRFFELVERMQVGLLSLCDTPGFMVGPESENSGALLTCSKMFVSAARLTVPIVCIVIRKAYGLGAMAMAGGDLFKPIYTASWPTGEFGGMGPEGAVQLGFKKELEAAESEEARAELFDKLLAQIYAKGKATEIAAFLEIDAVIDPSDTREVVNNAFSKATAQLNCDLN